MVFPKPQSCQHESPHWSRANRCQKQSLQEPARTWLWIVIVFHPDWQLRRAMGVSKCSRGCRGEVAWRIIEEKS